MYCHHKQDFRFEKYLFNIYISKFRRSLSNLKCDLLNISSDIGSFENTSREQIHCPVSNMNTIENGHHYMQIR